MTDICAGYKKTLVVCGFLLLFFSQAAVLAWRQSNTWDEPAHILAGYSLIKNGIDPAPREHPAFGHILQGIIPAAFLKLDFDASHLNYEYDPALRPPQEQFSKYFPYSLKFLFENKTDGRRLLFLSRLANIITGVVLGIYIFLWSSDLWGVKGAYLSLFIYALSPEFIAHSSLATTDLPGAAFFFIAAFYLYRRAFKDAGYADALACGLFIGLALTSKFTALLLLPCVFAAFVFSLFSMRRPAKETVLWFCVVCLAAYAALWFVYGFRYRPDTSLYEPLFWRRFPASPFLSFLGVLRRIKFLPEAYLYGLGGAASAASGNRAAFLMGAYSATGWWYYFMAAFVIKTPIPLIILIIASTLYAFKEAADRMKTVFLLFPVVVLFIALSAQNINIGLRHALPALPFLITLTGLSAHLKTQSRRAARAVLCALIAWYVYSSAAIFPHDLAYFNEFVGGPENGWRYLVDSNLDWGQDLAGLKEYMSEKNIKKIKLAYFGFSDPRYYGIEYDYLPSNTILNPQNIAAAVPLSGWFAISATMLQGVYLSDHDYYRVFRGIKPVDTVGHSILIYKLQAAHE